MRTAIDESCDAETEEAKQRYTWTNTLKQLQEDAAQIVLPTCSKNKAS